MIPVIPIIARIVGRDPASLSYDDELRADLHCCPAMIQTIYANVTEAFGIEFDDDTVLSWTTVGDVAASVERVGVVTGDAA